MSEHRLSEPQREEVREPQGYFAQRLPAREPVPEFEPTFRLEEYVREARRRMGEARWQRLQREWG